MSLSEKVPQRSSIFDPFGRVEGLRSEKDRKNEPLYCFRSWKIV
jgi:hypothetical protein